MLGLTGFVRTLSPRCPLGSLPPSLPEVFAQTAPLLCGLPNHLLRWQLRPHCPRPQPAVFNGTFGLMCSTAHSLVLAVVLPLDPE